MELLLKNANIVTDKETYMSDIYIKDGVIVNIDKKIEIPGVKTVDIGGKYLVRLEKEIDIYRLELKVLYFHFLPSFVLMRSK